MELSETQIAIVEFVTDYRKTNHRAPTYEEIADGIGVAVRAVQYQLDKLEAAGVVTRERRNRRVVPRSIEIVEAA